MSETLHGAVTITRRLFERPATAPFLNVFGSAVGEERLEWGQFWAVVEGYASAISLTTRPDDFILIMSRTRTDAIAFFFASICAGRLVSFFPPPSRVQDETFYRSQQSASIAKIAPDVVVTFDDASAAMVRDIGFGHVWRVFEAQPGNWRAAVQAFAARLEGNGAPVFVQHSSGTTGIKKAVAVSSSMLRAQFTAYWQAVIEPLAPEPKIASWLPLYHDMGLVATLILPTIGACEIAFVDPFTWVERPQSLFDVIAQERSNLVWMPNFAFRHYVRIGRAIQARDLSSVRAWINCSEPCRAVDAEAFEQRFAAMGASSNTVVGCYAMAESVFAVTQAEVGHRAVLNVSFDQTIGGAVRPGNRAVLSSGPAAPGLEIALFADGARIADDRYGEIGIRGDCIFGGYRQMTPEESNLRPDGFFLTGDRGALRNGELFVFGREKETIIVNGKNIFAGDVEAEIGAVEGLKAGRLVVFGVDNPLSGSEDLVVVAERDPSVATDRDDRAIVSDVTRLINAAFLISPHAVRIVGARWLAKTTSGKISRADNRLKYLREVHVDPAKA